MVNFKVPVSPRTVTGAIILILVIVLGQYKVLVGLAAGFILGHEGAWRWAQRTYREYRNGEKGEL